MHLEAGKYGSIYHNGSYLEHVLIHLEAGKYNGGWTQINCTLSRHLFWPLACNCLFSKIIIIIIINIIIIIIII